MRRAIALIIMFIVPLQFAWAAAVGVQGHVGDDLNTAGFHTHDHDHDHHDEIAHSDAGAHGGAGNQDHNADGHHGHCHPVFSAIFTEPGLPLGMALSGGPILSAPPAFHTRIPPLLDRPPLARA